MSGICAADLPIVYRRFLYAMLGHKKAHRLSADAKGALGMMNGYAFGDLSDRWIECDPELAEKYEQELRREVPPGHLLDGVACSAVAKRIRSDDVLFWLPKAKQWAIVHLTRQQEHDPAWPTTVIRLEWSEVCAELDDQGRR